MLTEQCIGRLSNWKFDQAVGYLTVAASPDERELVEALSRMFGNSGWFNGDMGLLVALAVEKLDRTMDR